MPAPPPLPPRPGDSPALTGLAPTVPPPPGLRAVADEMAAYVSTRSEPPTETYAPFATRLEFSGLLARVEQLEHAAGAAANGIGLLRGETNAGFDRLDALVLGWRRAVESSFDEYDEKIREAHEYAHAMRTAIRGMDKNSVSLAEWQIAENERLIAEQNKTRKIARAGNVAKLLVGAIILGFVTNIVPIVTLLARLFAGSK